MVVRRSMETRFYMEMAFFFGLAVIFQLQLLTLSEAYNKVNIDQRALVELELRHDLGEVPDDEFEISKL